VALHAAGAFERDTLLKLAALRGAACASCQRETAGAMAVVLAGQDQVRQILEPERLPASIANINCDNQTVIAGSQDTINQSIRLISARGLVARRIRAGAAFHTEAMQGARLAFSAGLEQLKIMPPAGVVFSNVTAEPMSNDPDSIRDLMSRQLTSPVRFLQQIESLHDGGARVFLEVGPGHVLTNLVSRILKDRQHSALAIDDRRDQSCSQLGETLGKLFALGAKLELLPWFEDRKLMDCSLADYLADVFAATQRRPIEFLVNTWRAMPLINDDPQRNPFMSSTEKNDSLDVAHDREQSQPSGLSTAGQSTEVSTAMFRPPSITELVKSARQTSQTGQTARVSPTTQNRQSISAVQTVPTQIGPTGPPNSHELMATLAEIQLTHQQAQLQFLQLQRELLSRTAAVVGNPGLNAVGNFSLNSSLPTADSAMIPELPADVIDPSPLSPVDHGPGPLDDLGQLLSIGREPNSEGNESQVRAVELNRRFQSETMPAFGSVGASRHSTSRAIVTEHGSKPSVDQFRNDLLVAISQRTGYPIDMLDEDMELEAGLGIDSIKMVEIFSTLKQYHAFLPGADNQEDHLANFANQKTIRNILDFYRSVDANQLDGKVNHGVGDSGSGTGSKLERKVLELTPTRLGEKKNDSRKIT
jgi:malonyl CoA-acyl carrier protein transacylase